MPDLIPISLSILTYGCKAGDMSVTWLLTLTQQVEYRDMLFGVSIHELPPRQHVLHFRFVAQLLPVTTWYACLAVDEKADRQSIEELGVRGYGPHGLSFACQLVCPSLHTSLKERGVQRGDVRLQ